MKQTITNANFPIDVEGRTYHVEIGPGEVANRIITVGERGRADEIKSYLDADFPITERVSHRQFVTITGRYKGVDVSIISIGMGFPMVDFFLREIRAVTTGTIAVIRFGSCGSINGTPSVGSIVVPRAAFIVTRNYDYFHPSTPKGTLKPYLISQPFDADPSIVQLLSDNLSSALAVLPEITVDVVTGHLNATADSFYSTQGRLDDRFWDDNEELIYNVIPAIHPDTQTLEMEAAQLFHLASCANPGYEIRAAAAMMIFADRKANSFILPETVRVVEPLFGRAVLDALVQIKL
jgi:uridine phosphorylase